MAEENIASPVEFNGKTYKPLADGKYDAIILGTGLKECILSGLLSVKGKKASPSSHQNKRGSPVTDSFEGTVETRTHVNIVHKRDDSLHVYSFQRAL